MNRTRRVVLASLLVALTVSLGYAFAAVPNIELMTLTVFCAGFLLGPGVGAIIGAVAIGLHSVFNPLGVALPPLLGAQVLGFAVVGTAGGLFGPVVEAVRHRLVASLASALVGLLLTLLYDVLTNVGAFLAITGPDRPTQGLAAFVVAGLLFTVMHVVWNTALFMLALKPILGVLARHRVELR